jgi:hypothetical protein
MEPAAFNVWAILVAAVSAFAVGGLWYSPALLGRAWMHRTGLTEADLARGNPALTYGVSFVLALVAAAVLAMFLGPKPEFGFAVGASVSAGVAWVGTSFGINYLFEKKSLGLFLINAGYHTVQYLIMGVILGLWP